MKLVFTPNPQYIHKVVVAAHEAGVLDKLQLERQVPFDEDTEIWRYNPLGKVPAFEMDDGQPLYGGLVICEYLDSFNKTAPLFPGDESRWQLLFGRLRESVTLVEAEELIRAVEYERRSKR